MIAFLQGLLDHAGSWGLVPIFLVIVLESSAFLGLFFPGEMAALITGALAAAQAFSLSAALATVIGAAIVGDVFGYILGRYRGEVLLRRWSFARRQYERHRSRLERYFERWGNATVIIGRFVAVGRAFVPFAAGLSEMPVRRFVPMAILAGALWGGAIVALGYLLGSNWRRVEGWLRSLGVGIFILLALTVLMAALWRWLARRQNEIAAAWQRRAQRYGIDLAPLVEFIRARLSPAGYLGLHFTVGLLAVGAMAWLFGGVTQDIFAQDPLVHIDQMVASVIARHHTAGLDRLVVVPAFLSNPSWLVFLVAVAAVASVLAGDFALAITAAPLLGGAYALAFGLQTLFSRVSPDVPEPKLIHGFAGFPSVTITAVVAAYGLACYAAAAHTTSWRLQTFAVIVTLYLILLAGLGALYGGGLLSATIGGFALGACWLPICLTGKITYDRLRDDDEHRSAAEPPRSRKT